MTLVLVFIVFIAFLVGLVIGIVFGAAMTVFFSDAVDDDSRQPRQHGGAAGVVKR